MDHWTNFIQGVHWNEFFCSSLLFGLNLLKCWWSMTHSLLRHGRFWYLKETLIKSQYGGQQSHCQSDVKIEDFSNILLKLMKKLHVFKNFGENFCFIEKDIVFNEFPMFWWFQNCTWCGFYHIWNSFNLIFASHVVVKSCKLKNSWFLTSDLGWHCWSLH